MIVFKYCVMRNIECPKIFENHTLALCVFALICLLFLIHSYYSVIVVKIHSTLNASVQIIPPNHPEGKTYGYVKFKPDFAMRAHILPLQIYGVTPLLFFQYIFI